MVCRSVVFLLNSAFTLDTLATRESQTCGRSHTQTIEKEANVKADLIIKNAKIFTSDKDKPEASALVVKDGKFAYVGDEAGLCDFESEAIDLGGKFIMPGIIDSHIHITFGAGYEFADMGLRFECDSKQGCLDFISDYMKENPGQKRYKFMLDRKYLKGEALTKDDLDAICPDGEIIIVEAEGHSVWLNSNVLALNGITDETPDAVPGLSMYERRDGHLTRRATESSALPFQFDNLKNVADEEIKKAVTRWIDYSVHDGVTSVFDAGFPANEAFHERSTTSYASWMRKGSSRCTSRAATSSPTPTSCRRS